MLIVQEDQFSCPPLDAPANAMVMPGGCEEEPQPLGVYCVVVCNPNHIRVPGVGNKTRVCGDDTYWTGDDIVCERGMFELLKTKA